MASEQLTETSEEFQARVGSIIGKSFTSFGLYLGHEIGLFDILADMKEEAKTSQEIADAGNFKERYVREWLGAMVTAHIVELDPTGEKYYLPTHRVPALTTDGELSGDILVGCLLPSFGGNVYDQIKDCFKKDGPRGVSYANYTSSYKTLGKMTKKFLEAHVTTAILSPYPELQSLLSNGISVLDVGCGEGVSTIAFGKAFPKSNIYGFELMEESANVGKENAERLQLKNVKFIIGDATKMPADWDDKFDFVFCHDCIHDMACPDRALSGIHRILAPGGILLALEPYSYSKVKDNLEKIPGIEMVYMISLLHCMPTSLNSEGGMGLGQCGAERKQ